MNFLFQELKSCESSTEKHHSVHILCREGGLDSIETGHLCVGDEVGFSPDAGSL
jgi:hypothetical protein